MSTIRTFEKLLKMFNLMLLFFREKSVPKLGQSSLFWSPTRNENEQQILLTDSKRKQHLEYIGISEHVKLKNFKIVCSLCNN